MKINLAQISNRINNPFFKLIKIKHKLKKRPLLYNRISKYKAINLKEDFFKSLI
jgi:hypothetical protein